MKDITEFSNIHTHLQEGEDCIVSLPLGASVPEQGYYSVGLHPWDTERLTEADIRWAESAAVNPRVVAIGESGLDALRGAPLAEQEEIFRRQAALSELLEKPLIIHAVRTLQRLIELRKELRPRQRWIIHGFRGGPQLAASLLRAGFDLSYGHRYNPASYALTPPSRRFHETDTTA